MIPDEPPPTSVPGWFVTFADLMTLLMCFYVLMLSFSEMDVAKFKELSGSMQEAFGVQAEVNLHDIPRGTSTIAHEFTPGRPDPAPSDTVRQFTIDASLNTLDVGRAERLAELERREQEARLLTERMELTLASAIASNAVSIRQEGANVVIQILEQDSFRSGQAELDADFLPVLRDIGIAVAELPNAIQVAGHTDDVPISRPGFRSNWDLSASRAASVAHALLASGIDPTRIVISGHADTRPQAPNDSDENRARNRRIDITLEPTQDPADGGVPAAPAAAGANAP